MAVSPRIENIDSATGGGKLTGTIRTYGNGSNNNSYYDLPEAYRPIQISIHIRKIIQDKNGNMWFATHGQGVCMYDGKFLRYFSMKEGFIGNVVRDIKEDRKGNIWFATNNGVSRFDGEIFTDYTEKDGLVSNDVWSVAEDNTTTAGNVKMWFGTDKGACSFNGKKFTKLDIPLADLKNHPDAYQAPALVSAIFQDRTGVIWFGTNGGGVYSYNPKTNPGAIPTLKHYSETNGLSNNFIQSISQDKSGDLWFSTRFGGASEFDGKNFTRMNTEGGLKSNFVWSVFEDANSLWFATSGGGISKFDGKTVKHFSTKDGLPADYVQCIFRDNAGNLWVGTGFGLAKFEKDKFIAYNNVDGC